MNTIRQFLALHPRWTIATSAFVLLIGLLLIVQNFRGNGRGDPADSLLFYTTDDGKTLFTGHLIPAPPFPHAGAEAVRARVFAYPGKPQSVLWLEKYTPAGKKLLEAGYAPNADQRARMALNALPNEVLVKKLGTGIWLPIKNPNYGSVTARPLDSTGNAPAEVFP